MNRRLLTIILILLLLVSWIICHDLYTDKKDLLNALKIAENSLDELQEEIEYLSIAVDNYKRELNRGNDWNEEAIPEYRR